MIVNRINHINNENPFNLPDFFVAGSPRSGTTSLYQYLSYHPDLLLSSPKEPRFFVFRGLSADELEFESEVVLKASVLDIKTYSEMFKSGKDKICGDFTVTALKYHHQFIQNVNELYPEKQKPKVIIALRNPIEAAFSYYTYLYMSREIVEPDFLTFLKSCRKDYINKSDNIKSVSSFFDTYDYAVQLKAILNAFDDVFIFLLDDLKTNADKTLMAIDEFLGIPFNRPKDLGEIYNRSGTGKRSWIVSSGADVIKNKVAKLIPEAMGRRMFSKLRHYRVKKAKMDDLSKTYLKEHFSKVIVKTGEIIDRDLSFWMDI